MLNAEEFARKLNEPVFKAVEERLNKRYKINLKNHMAMEEVSGTIDPSLGGRIPSLKNSPGGHAAALPRRRRHGVARASPFNPQTSSTSSPRSRMR